MRLKIKNRRFWSVVADFLAVAGFALSVFIACQVFPNSKNTSFDYQAIMVGIIAAIFTLLVGWNIFQVVDWRSDRRALQRLQYKLKRELNYIHNQADYYQAITYAMESQAASSRFSPYEREATKYQMLLKGIQALKILSHFPDTENEIDNVTKTLILGLYDSRDIKLSEDDVAMLLIYCGEIENRNKIKGFNEVINLLKES